MGLVKNIRGKSGAIGNFSDINKVTFIGNSNGTFTVVAYVFVFANKTEKENLSEPLETRVYNFQVPQNQGVGNLRRFIINLIKSTDDYSGATEDGET
jgi:hypothetical protein